MVYVDEIKEYSGKNIAPQARKHGNLWCHMWSEDEEELHSLAKQLGLKRSYFQNSNRNPLFYHYDLTPSKREEALKLGAKFKPSREHTEEILEKIYTPSQDN